METNDNDYDKSLLRCTVKKSVSVIVKWAKAIACLIGGGITAILAWLGVVGIYEIAAPVLSTIINIIIGTLVSIPWYYYVGVTAILAVPVYSLLWCISRYLIKEDWESNEALALALAAVIALALALAAVIALALAAVIALVLALALALAVALAVAAVDDSTSAWYYVFRFTGAAWHHYRCRK